MMMIMTTMMIAIDDNDDDDSGHVDRGRGPVLHLGDGTRDPVDPRSWVHSQVRTFNCHRHPPGRSSQTIFLDARG